jgi:hypothetical protein
VDGTDLGSCPTRGFSISGAEPLVSTVKRVGQLLRQLHTLGLEKDC